MKEAPETTAAYSYARKEPPDEIIPIECVGHIRPHKTYDKDLGYGFDWMRVGDTSYGGNSIAYKDICGKFYTSDLLTLVMDQNEYDELRNKFRTDESEFKRLENEYKMASGAKVFIKPDKGELERYYVPILALPRMKDIKELELPPIVYPYSSSGVIRGMLIGAGIGNFLSDQEGEKHFVKLELRLTITKPPKKLYWELPEKYRESTSKLVKGKPIEIKCPELPVGLCKDKKIEFDIGCNTIIPETIDVKLMALGHNGKSRMVGVFRIWKNTPRKKKVLLVQVISNVTGNKKMYFDNELIKEAEMIKKYMSQALVIPQIEIVTNFDMAGTGWRAKNNLEDFGKTGKLYVQNDFKPELNLYEHLYKHFSKGYTRDNDTVILFYIKEDAYKKKKLGLRKDKDEEFYAASQSEEQLIIYAERETREVTATHEIIHAMGVYHSFTNTEVKTDKMIAKYTFRPLATDNIMDYSIKIPRFSMWQWQWEHIHKK